MRGAALLLRRRLLMRTGTHAFAILAGALGLWSIGIGQRWLYPGPLSSRDITPTARRSPQRPEWPKGPLPYPAGAFVTAKSDRAEFFLGENPLVLLTVTNRGIMPFWIFEGGDYRGGTRSWRFEISVRNYRGEALPDPMPEQPMMGGMGKYHFVRPGESHTYSALLSRYALVDRPGGYEVEVRHDLGTRGFMKRGRLSHASRFSLTFAVPEPEQARAIAAKAGELKWPKSDSRSDDLGEYVNLRSPVYLPFVEDALRRGEANAVLALGHMRGQVATERLVAWAGDAVAAGAIRSSALLMLAARSPITDPQWRSIHVVIAPAILREGAWTEETRRGALALARERIQQGFNLGGEEATAAATLVGALGDAGDADRLLALWRQLMEKHRKAAGKGVSAEWGPSGYSLAFALDQLRGRGWTPPFPVADEGDTDLWLFFAAREKARGAFSTEIRSILAAWRGHPEARVRSRVEELLRPPASAR